jgi:hypothetical protein
MNGNQSRSPGPTIDIGRRKFMLGAASACGAAGFLDSLWSNAVLADENLKPRLQATIRRAEGLTSLVYVVTNPTNRAMFIFNMLYQRIDSRGFVIDPDLCNVEVRDNAVHLSKKIFPVPPGILVERENVPCVSEVPAGQDFREQMTLRTPLHQWNPYIGSDHKAERVYSLPVVFEVGYFYEAPGTRKLAKVVPTSTGNAMRFDPFPVSSQSIVAVGPLANRIDVLA